MSAVQKIQESHTFCLIQLTRIGDVLQTFQAASALRYEYPQIRLILVARRQFASGLNFLLRQVFDEIYTFDTKDFLTENPNSLKAVTGEMREFISTINKEKIDILFNLSFSKSSSYLATLIKADHKMGLVRDLRGQLVVNDRWSQFVYSNVMNGPHNPFNLTDIYRKMLGTKEIPLSYERTVNISHKKKIVIHPFASTKKKRWGVTKWTEVIYQILKSHSEAYIQVMGGPGDVNESKQIAESEILRRFHDRIQFNVGNLSLEETFNNLADADLFIGHDSMGGHMAAINSVPTITLSLGTVRPNETTPYSTNSYNISPRIKCFPCFPNDKCELLPCHTNISYQAITTLVEGILANETINSKYLTSKLSGFHLENIYIHQALLTNQGLDLQELTGNNLELAGLFQTYYKITWGFVFSEEEYKVSSPKISGQQYSELSNYQSGIQNLFELNNFGIKYSQYILEETKAQSPRLAMIKDYSNKLSEIDQLTNLLKSTFPLLAPLIDFYFVAKANLKGNNIIELAESSYVTFYEFNNAVQVMNELIEQTLKEGKARMVGPKNSSKVIDN